MELELTNDTMKATKPLPTKAQQEWHRCRHYIERAIAEGLGRETIEDVEREVEAYRQIFWAHASGAAITRIDQYATDKVLTVVLAAGDLSDSEMISAFLPDLETFARIAGCNHIAVDALPKHVSLFETAGFAPLTCRLEKPVPASEPPASEAAVPGGAILPDTQAAI